MTETEPTAEEAVNTPSNSDPMRETDPMEEMHLAPPLSVAEARNQQLQLCVCCFHVAVLGATLRSQIARGHPLSNLNGGSGLRVRASSEYGVSAKQLMSGFRLFHRSTRCAGVAARCVALPRPHTGPPKSFGFRLFLATRTDSQETARIKRAPT